MALKKAELCHGSLFYFFVSAFLCRLVLCAYSLLGLFLLVVIFSERGVLILCGSRREPVRGFRRERCFWDCTWCYITGS